MAQKQYQQLTIEEREKIQWGLWEKISIRDIAHELSRSPSTISREINRNITPHGKRYFPRLAQEKTMLMRKSRGMRPRLKHQFIRHYVCKKLKDGLSPEQITGRLRFEYPEYSISHEAIYQYIYSQYRRDGYGICIGCDLRKYLRRHHKARKPKKIPFKPEKINILDRISIDKRPKYIDKRKQQGHWEGDSLVSRKSLVGLNTLVERVSGLVFISKIKNGAKEETIKAVSKRLINIPKKLRKTLTMDNGHENAGHEVVARKLETKCYFAHPYHSWERGTNENTNGLIRWYLPKGTDFAKISNRKIQRIENILNNRPRKRLGFKTPLEVFNRGVAVKY